MCSLLCVRANFCVESDVGIRPHDRPKTEAYRDVVCVFVCAGVAQLVEQLICNQQVAGSSPIASSIPNTGTLRMGTQVAKGDRL